MKIRSLGSSLLPVALSLTSIAANAASSCPKFKYSDVKINITGATEVDSYAINNSGVIAGDYVDSSGVQHGMLAKGNQVQTIDNSNCEALTLTFYGINSTNTAAGTCTSSSTGLPIAFVWSKGKLTNIVPPGSISANAQSVNDKNEVLGGFTDSNGQQHGFLLSSGKYTQLDPPSDAGLTVNAWSINNEDVITIYEETGTPQYLSYVTTNLGKTYVPVAYPGAGPLGTVIHGVNNKGGIDGTYYDSNSAAHGFAYYKGAFCSLDDPNAELPSGTRADGINDGFEFVGRYTNSSGVNVGFSALP